MLLKEGWTKWRIRCCRWLEFFRKETLTAISDGLLWSLLIFCWCPNGENKRKALVEGEQELGCYKQNINYIFLHFTFRIHSIFRTISFGWMNYYIFGYNLLFFALIFILRYFCYINALIFLIFDYAYFALIFIII